MWKNEKYKEVSNWTSRWKVQSTMCEVEKAMTEINDILDIAKEMKVVNLKI